jgi:anti-sigma B factor antagonist
MPVRDFLAVGHALKGAISDPMMTQSLPENHSFRDGVFSVQLEGPVDMITVPELRKALLCPTKKHEIMEIHVDFSQVTALDTSGVAMLVEVWKGLARRGAVLRLTGLSEQARRLIQLARLDQVFEIGNDPDGRT